MKIKKIEGGVLGARGLLQSEGLPAEYIVLTWVHLVA